MKVEEIIEKDKVRLQPENEHMQPIFVEFQDIELIGKVTPNFIKAGEMLKIIANTKSLSKIATVMAESKELGINSELNKISEHHSQLFRSKATCAYFI